jgi:hypothetical protein
LVHLRLRLLSRLKFKLNLGAGCQGLGNNWPELDHYG